MNTPDGSPPLVRFEDDHLLVADKPAGLNTHSPSPFAGEGLYEWLRDREPRWASLAIIHRLDKQTSGLIVFAKSVVANQSLTAQFAERRVRKKYRLLTDGRVPRREMVVRSNLQRSGDKYKSATEGQFAETRFKVIEERVGRTIVEAEPRTGRTHQIRVHASESGFPILGDTLYGGSPANRIQLHSAELAFAHPASGKELCFESPADFSLDPRIALRGALVEVEQTQAYRVVHGASDGHEGWYVDRLGAFLLSSSASPLTADQERALADFAAGTKGRYHKVLTRGAASAGFDFLNPLHVNGVVAAERFLVRENSAHFELSFREGYSIGLFLDQRDNRRRFLTKYVAPDFFLFENVLQPEILNTFAYTCGFSVCAARGGARTTSIDLSRKYLEWGRRNFQHNNIPLEGHDFIYGDVFEWLRRLAKKQRSFDAVILDPPTASRSREHGFFVADKDYGKLVTAALPLLKPEGVLLACTNAARLRPEAFVDTVKRAICSAGRGVFKEHYVPQPPDFPISREEPAHLKTIWLKIS